MTLLPAPAGSVSADYALTVQVEGRDEAVAKLKAAGIPAMVYYPVPLHRTTAYGGAAGPALPVAERAAERVMSLPIFPGMTRGQVAQVTQALRAALA